jgi:hypothetical protein
MEQHDAAAQDLTADTNSHARGAKKYDETRINIEEGLAINDLCVWFKNKTTVKWISLSKFEHFHCAVVYDHKPLKLFQWLLRTIVTLPFER